MPELKADLTEEQTAARRRQFRHCVWRQLVFVFTRQSHQRTNVYKETHFWKEEPYRIEQVLVEIGCECGTVFWRKKGF